MPTPTILEAVKTYLGLDGLGDESTDARINGYIERGKKRLQQYAGASLDFNAEGAARELLLDYCRYANSNALEVFEQNFTADITALNLNTQAPICEVLNFTITAEGVVSIYTPCTCGDDYVYKVGSDLVLPQCLDFCTPRDYTSLAGTINAESGQEVVLVEIDLQHRAIKAGKVIV